MFRYKVIINILCLAIVDSARILGVFPTPSVSHQVVFRPIIHELAKRGHDVVVITPNPVLQKDRPPDNITEIDVSFSYGVLNDLKFTDKILNKRGIVVDVDRMTSFEPYKEMVDMFAEQLKSREVANLIQDKKRGFDLIIAESFLDYHNVFSHIFKAPIISISSFHGMPENYETMGAIGRHPTLYPSVLQQNFKQTLFEQIYQIYMYYKHTVAFEKVVQYEDKLLKTNFGPDTPTVHELRNNIELLLLNSHPIFCNNKPVPPNVIYIGPLHLQPVKELPKDLKEYLDNSENGVIYVSLGTNVRPSEMDEDLLNVFLDTFEALPYNILWKFDGDDLKRVPKNVRIQKWFPQRDLLMHPNIKLFVTQAGMQSTEESIDAGVPLVAIPIHGDQFYNANKYVELGFGVSLDALILDKEMFLGGIDAVLNDESYKKNIKKVRNIIFDHPQTPFERAMWWTEYVLRHSGARHLRAASANITWREYLMADIFIPLFLVLLITSAIFIIIIVKIAKMYSNTKKSVKLKKSYKNKIN